MNKPLEQYVQSLELHHSTIAAIVNLVNSYCDTIEDNEHRVDPLNILEKDIQNLIILASPKQEDD